MRSLLLLCLLAFVSFAVAQRDVCPSMGVELQLRPSPTYRNQFQLAFVSVDPAVNRDIMADFVDIHYRINNDESVNLRVVTQAALTDLNERATQAQVDGVILRPGDVIRAYATYSAQGIACDTPIHTFNAPTIEDIEDIEFSSARRFGAAAAPRSARRMQQSTRDRSTRARLARAAAEEHFWTQAAIEAELNHAAGVCPALAMDQDVLKEAGKKDAYVLTFENKTPGKQLHFVDLHIATDSEPEWLNLRLASDMQLEMAHKVMQPGVTIKPNEQLSWYWSYRAESADGQLVDCSTPITSIRPEEVTHQVNLDQQIGI